MFLKIIFLIIGALIGAGFASGQEINLFFNSFGKDGIYGLIITVVLLGIILYKVFSIMIRYNIDSYEDFIKVTMNSKSKKLNMFINSFINIFLLAIFYIMIAGFSAFLYQEYNLPHLVGSIFSIFICYVTLRKDISGIMKISNLFIPILIVLIIILGILKIDAVSFTTNYTNVFTNNFIISSVIYASYNIVLLIPVLVTLRKYLINKKQAIKVAVLCSVIVLVLSLIIFLLLASHTDNINAEIPIISIASELGSVAKYIYGVVIMIAIYTTAISTGYGFLKNTSKEEKKYNKLLIFMCISAIFISKIGFSTLLNILYPIFGILGIIQILFLIKT